MEQSILTSTKKILGIDEEYMAFDLDILTHINAAFTILNGLGVGPEDGFFVEDSRAVWTDFMTQGPSLHLVRTYIFLKVRMLFDPPSTSFLQQNMTDQIREYEWRLSTIREGETWVPTT